MRSKIRVSTAFVLVVGGLIASAASAAPREIKLIGNDAMQYSVTKIEAKPGETLKVILTTESKMAKAEMAHNFVLLKPGTDVDAFIMAAAMARRTKHIPAAKKADILASTDLAGGGETVEVVFEVPKEKGEYLFVCTFPGHYAAGMKGVLVVK